MNENIIVFASDNEYIKYLSVAICSLVSFADNSKNYEIYILEKDVSEENKEKLYKYKNQFIDINFINMQEYCNKYKINEFFISRHLNEVTYYRLFIPDIFKNAKKVLYLDSDIIVNTDISEFFNIDIPSDKYVLAVKDYGQIIRYTVKEPLWVDYVENSLSLLNPAEYFNAGVIMFDIKKCIENNTVEIALKKLDEIKYPYNHDQDILNSVFSGHVELIDCTWNFLIQKILYTNYGWVLTPDEIIHLKEVIKNPKIYHYVTEIKPWDNLEYEHMLKWWNFANKSKHKNEFDDNKFIKSIKEMFQ